MTNWWEGEGVKVVGESPTVPPSGVQDQDWWMGPGVTVAEPPEPPVPTPSPELAPEVEPELPKESKLHRFDEILSKFSEGMQGLIAKLDEPEAYKKIPEALFHPYQQVIERSEAVFKKGMTDFFGSERAERAIGLQDWETVVDEMKETGPQSMLWKPYLVKPLDLKKLEQVATYPSYLATRGMDLLTGGRNPFEWAQEARQPTEDVWDWWTRTLPESLEAEVYNIIKFFAHDLANEFILPVADYTRRAEELRTSGLTPTEKFMRSEQLKVELFGDLGDALWMVLQGLTEYTVKPWPGVGWAFYGYDEWKDLWWNDPGAAIVGITPIVRGLISTTKGAATSRRQRIAEERGARKLDDQQKADMESAQVLRTAQEISAATELAIEHHVGGSAPVPKAVRESKAAAETVIKERVGKKAKPKEEAKLSEGERRLVERVSADAWVTSQRERILTRRQDGASAEQVIGELWRDRKNAPGLASDVPLPELSKAVKKFYEGVTGRVGMIEVGKPTKAKPPAEAPKPVEPPKPTTVAGFPELEPGLFGSKQGAPFTNLAAAEAAARTLRKKGQEGAHPEVISPDKWGVRVATPAERARVRELFEKDIGEPVVVERGTRERRRATEELFDEVEYELSHEIQMPKRRPPPEPEPHPFRTAPERTKEVKGHFDQKSDSYLAQNPDAYYAYQLNVMNQFLDGAAIDPSIPLGRMRELALNTEHTSVRRFMPDAEMRQKLRGQAVEAVVWFEREMAARTREAKGTVDMLLGPNVSNVVIDAYRAIAKDKWGNIQGFWDAMKNLMPHLSEVDMGRLRTSVARLGDEVIGTVAEVGSVMDIGRVSPGWIERIAREEGSLPSGMAVPQVYRDVSVGGKTYRRTAIGLTTKRDLMRTGTRQHLSDLWTPLHEVGHSVFNHLIPTNHQRRLMMEFDRMTREEIRSMEVRTNTMMFDSSEMFSDAFSKAALRDPAINAFPEFVRDYAKKAVEEFRRPEVVELHAGLPAKETFRFAGKEAWAGVVNTLDGKIEQVVTYSKAQRHRFRHREYFERYDPDTSAIFFIDKDGRIEWEWGDWTGERLPPRVLKSIREQIELIPEAFEPGVKLYSGLPVPEAVRQVKALYEGVRKAKAGTPLGRAEKARMGFWKGVIDTQGNLKNAIEKWTKSVEEPLRGNVLNTKIILARGGGGQAAQLWQMYKKSIYGDLDRASKTLLDNVIFSRRVIQIDKAELEMVARGKKPRDIKHPGGLGMKEHQAYLEYLRKELGEAKFTELMTRADIYFGAMRGQLKMLFDDGLISERSYKNLSRFDWQRRQAVDVMDPVVHLGKFETRLDVRDSGIESLKRGKVTDVLETDSALLLQDWLARSQGRIYRNRANQEMAKLVKDYPENPFIREKKPADNWHPVKFYEEGKLKTYYMPRDWAKEWLLRETQITYEAAQKMRLISGSFILRPMATGINIGFAFTNFFRDMAHIWMVSNYMDAKGNWRATYSPYTAPIQFTKDLAEVSRDAVLRTGKYKEYVADGGSMEFLVWQGRVLEQRLGKHQPLESAQTALGYVGATSEIVTRLALRERALKRIAERESEIRGKRVTKEDIRTRPEFHDQRLEATGIARDYLDFGQGGSYTKSADAALPYLNSVAQATRGIFKSATRNPQEFAAKVGMTMATAYGFYLSQRYMAPEAMKDVSPDLLRRNWVFFPFGDHHFIDEQGQKRYLHLKVPKDEGQQFFATLAEFIGRKLHGDEMPPAEQIVKTLTDLSPVDVSSLPPSVSAYLGYVTNVDFWNQDRIWRGPDVEPSEEWGPGTPEYAKAVGRLTGMSPERLDHALKQIFTQGNVYTYPMGWMTDKVFEQFPQDTREEHMAVLLSQAPIAKRFIGVTAPYGQHRKDVDDIVRDDSTWRLVNNRMVDMLYDRYDGKDVTRKDLLNYIGAVKDPKERERLMDRVKFNRQVEGLSERKLWLRLHSITPAARAEYFHRFWKDATSEERRTIAEEASQVPGIFTDEFKRQLSRIMAGVER